MDDTTFDNIAREELRHIEDQLFDVDPDEVDVSSSDGVLTLELRDGVRIVINSHRAARQIWMAAIADAWKFDYDQRDSLWRTAGSPPAELRQTIHDLIKRRIGLEIEI